METGDRERLGRIVALRHAGDDAIVDRGPDRQWFEGRSELVEIIGHGVAPCLRIARDQLVRSEEHTSELQSLMRISYAVFCLKKKKSNDSKSSDTQHENSYPLTRE